MKHHFPLLTLALLVLLIAPLTATAGSSAATHTAAPTAGPNRPAATPAAAAPAAAEKVIVVKVALESGKAGQALPAAMLSGADITLYAIAGNQPVYTRQAKTDAEGAASFAGLPYQDGLGFGAVAKVGLTAYVSDLAAPTAGAAEMRVPVKVYPTTTDTSKLRVSQAFVLAEALGDGKLRVTDLYVLSNDGDKTIEGGLKDAEGKVATLAFPLPAGAESVQFAEDKGSGIALTNGGFLSRPGVQPGADKGRVIVTYSMPYTDSLRFDTKLAYPTDKLTVFVATQGITLTGSLMKSLPSQQREDGVTMNVWGAEKLPPNQAISFELKGKPVEPPPPLPVTLAKPASATGLQGFVSARKPVELAGLALIAAGLLLAVCAAGWWLYRERLAPDPNEREARALVAALADLQEDHEAGRVAPEDYEQRRLLLTEALASLMAPTPFVPTPLTGPEAF